MAKKRGPGRPPLSAAEKARRKAEREAAKGVQASAKRKPGRPAGSGVKRKPGRPVKIHFAKAPRGRKPKEPTEQFPNLIANVMEKMLVWEQSVQKELEKASCTNALADRTATLEAQLAEYAKALQTVTDAAAATEAKLAQLCENLNNYFNNGAAVPAEVAQEETPVAANQ